MDKSDLPDLYQQVTQRVITALERGVAPWVRPWSVEPDPVPLNAATRRPYRGVNFVTLQLESQLNGYPHNRWMTYQQALKLGAQVRRGEHGIAVVFWQLRKVASRVENEPWPDESALSERVIPLLRAYTVFNVAQIDGLPEIRTDAPESVWQEVESAEDVLTEAGANIRHGGSVACFRPREDVIQLPARTSFLSASDYYATALHELIHWTGHPTRLNRDLSGRFGDGAYAMEELVAELGSAFLCARCRVDGQLQHESYIDHWLKALKQDKRAIFVAATKAQNAADYLLPTHDPLTEPAAVAAA